MSVSRHIQLHLKITLPPKQKTNPTTAVNRQLRCLALIQTHIQRQIDRYPQPIPHEINSTVVSVATHQINLLTPHINGNLQDKQQTIEYLEDLKFSKWKEFGKLADLAADLLKLPAPRPKYLRSIQTAMKHRLLAIRSEWVETLQKQPAIYWREKMENLLLNKEILNMQLDRIKNNL